MVQGEGTGKDVTARPEASGNPGATTKGQSEQDRNLSDEDDQQDGDNNVSDRVTDFEAKKLLGLLLVVIEAHYTNSPWGRQSLHCDTNLRRFAIRLLA